MYFDALSFLEDEREAWRPFEALDELTDDQLEQPVQALNGWTGRDLMAHLIAWLEVSLAAAKELAVNETSPTLARIDAEWEAGSDALNDRLLAEWRELPMEEVRRRFRTVPGELRGYLTVVPETRWIKHAQHQESFVGESLEHYEDHLADLQAVLAQAGR
ncbi:MAG TPA: maleylpyruvate isomerase N-terminal domain-containing protein [Candidatus Limnocylindrales bacterium]|nr:maleylpyruvate isomerase N-terminal domain-containing protein [Candidatus Limnocylindrales bacterium]